MDEIHTIYNSIILFLFPLRLFICLSRFLVSISLWFSGYSGWVGDHYYCCNAIDAIIIRKFVLQHYPCSGHPHNTTQQ